MQEEIKIKDEKSRRNFKDMLTKEYMLNCDAFLEAHQSMFFNKHNEVFLKGFVLFCVKMLDEFELTRVK